jgi:hypothetical protein
MNQRDASLGCFLASRLELFAQLRKTFPDPGGKIPRGPAGGSVVGALGGRSLAAPRQPSQSGSLLASTKYSHTLHTLHTKYSTKYSTKYDVRRYTLQGRWLPKLEEG